MLHLSRPSVRHLLRALFVALALTATAHAETEAAGSDANPCISGFEQSQVYRKGGKLRSARQELLKCAQLQCKPVVRDQCTMWLEEVDTATPSVIIDTTVNGEDTTDIKIEVDGAPATDWQPGKPLELDPGSHVLKVTVPEFPPSERRIVTREGEKRRVFTFTFGETKGVGAILGPQQPGLAPPPPVIMHRPVQPITYVLAGTAVVGVGAFAVLGVLAKNKEDELASDPPEGCKPKCSDDQVNDLKSRYLMANIALGVGGAAALGALITFVARPSEPMKDTGFVPSLIITPKLAAASAQFRF
jgi:hypothetical protein